MTQYLVYLTGLIYGSSMDWREYASRSFSPHIQGVSPLRAKRYLDDGKKIEGTAYTFPLSTDHAVNTHVRFDTLRSTAILLNLLGAERVSIGTAMEMAWAHDHGIPVVAAMEPEGNVHEHPMIRDSISVRVGSLDEAIEAMVAIVSPAEKLIWTRCEQSRMLMEEGRFQLGTEALLENQIGTHPH